MPGRRPRAFRLMRKLHKATGGKPQHWETLDNLGVVQADAAGIVYAVEMGWMLVAPKHDPHSALPRQGGSRWQTRPNLRGVCVRQPARQ